MKDAEMRVFPVLKREKTQAFLAIALTLIGCIIFGLFAINPTIATILQLQKQLSDDAGAYSQLVSKVNNLSALQGKYNDLQPDLPLVLAAVPDTNHIPELLGQIQALALKENCSVITLQSNPLVLSPYISKQDSTVSISLTIQGSNQNILNFIHSFTKFERILTIDEILISSVSTSDNNQTQALIQASAYFRPL